VGEPAVVLKNECRTRGQRSGRRVPVNAVRQINIKTADNRLAAHSHVRGAGKICLLNILQLLDQDLLGAASGARIQLDGALIHHDRKSKPRVSFRLAHDQVNNLVHGIVTAVPINDDSINTPAHHVLNLPLHLRGIRGTVPDVHVVRLAEPGHQVRVHLRRRIAIKQRMNVHFAHVAGTDISVCLAVEAGRSAGVVGGLRGKCCGGMNGELSHAH
jgi:hypothetical protein